MHNPIVFEQKTTFETGLKLDAALLLQNAALKDKDFLKYKEMQNKNLSNVESILKIAELNLGRDDSDAEDLDAIDEEVELPDFDTQSIIDEIKQDIKEAEEEARHKDQAAEKRGNAEETFERIRLFCQNQLNFSFRDVEKMIDSLITKPKEEISPLLKFYNELAAHSNFRLPVKSLLEFDTRLYRA